MSQEPNEISLSNRANLNQSKLSKMHCISYGAREHKTRSGLCFEVKQIQFTVDFHYISEGRIFAADSKYELIIFRKNWDQRSKSG